MSALLFMVAIGGFALWWSLRYGGERRTPWLFILCGALVPAAFAAVTLNTARGELGDVRLRLEAVEIAPGRSASIGGDPARDDIVVANEERGLRAPAGFIQFVRTSEGNVVVRVSRDMGNATPAVVELDDRLVGRARFRPRDSLCIAGCGEGQDAVRARFAGDRLRGVEDDTLRGPPMTRRPMLVEGLPFVVVDWGPEQRIYPLINYAPEPEAQPNGETDRQAAPLSASAYENSFFFRERRYFSDALYWVALAPSPNLVAPTPIDARTLVLPASACTDEVELDIHWVRMGDRPPRGEAFWRPGRLVSARTVLASLCHDGVLHLRFQTPETIVLAKRDLATERNAQRSNATVVSLGPPLVPRDGEARFASLGERIRLSLDSRVRIGPNEMALQAEGREEPLAHNRALALGGDGRAVVRFDRLSEDWPPAVLALLILIASTLASLVATFAQQRRSFANWALFTLVQWLTAWGVLVGFQATVFDPGTPAARGFGQSLCAFAMAPFLLHAATARLSDRWLLAAHALFATAALWWIGRALGDISYWRLAPLAPGLIVLVVLAGSKVGARVAQSSAELSDRTVLPVLGALDAAATFVSAGMKRGLGLFRLEKLLADDPGDGPGRDWWALLGVVVAFRIAFWLIGFSEAVTGFGPRIALSIVYAPMVALVFALLFARRVSLGEGASEKRFGLALLWAFGLLSIAIPALVRDNGAAIFGLAPALYAIAFLPNRDRRDWLWPSIGAICAAVVAALVVFAIVASEINPNAELLVWLSLPVLALLLTLHLAAPASPAWRWRAVWGIPGATIVAIVALVALAPLLHLQGANGDDLIARTEVGRNQLRMLQLIAPERVVSIGTIEAEQFRAAMVHLSDHTRLLWGYGYLTAPHPIELANYHMTDNVSAVHVMAPFGRVGGATFVLVSVLLASAFAYASRPRAAQDDAIGEDADAGADARKKQFAATGAALLVWTLVGASAYMFLANVQAVPFTGRNVYLLAIVSMSDFIEAMVLLCMAKLFAERASE